MKYPTKELEKKYTDNELKVPLQRILNKVINDENSSDNGIGDCVEFLLKENMIMVLCGLANNDKPHGLLVVVLRFMRYIMQDFKNVEILNYRLHHMALMKLL
eukprot:CAMPEP_0116871656 /NCGR_PEP_ID=MMETSP0463-20121206/2120_1 /TAXON_ID=181622 /ORGANISM="Strombidinopsis sp, Strain SopsisLIS2011" /LENGTH=101 /DNA_ID=CAMNT_0004510523 /DNA_START=414 /DNA_END=719 /DNA_ORIENTATION=+